jgi:hypothetical protein
LEWLRRVAIDGERRVKKLPEGKVAGGRKGGKGRPRLRWMVYVDLNLRNMSVKRRIDRASGRRE